MPTLGDLLAQTMLFTGLRTAGRDPLAAVPGKRFHSPPPKPKPFAEIEDEGDAREQAALRNAIWRYAWNPATPGKFTDVTCLTRGMGMDYGMPAIVLDRAEFRSCEIVRQNKEKHPLPLAPDFMLGAWWQTAGRITGGERLWPLETNIDTGMVVAFGYQLTDDGIAPLSMSEIEELGDELIPAEGWLRGLKFKAGDPGEHFVCIGPCRYILLVELVLCKERPDFVPGNLVGFARIQPHAFVWSNEELESTEISIHFDRPAHGMKCGAKHGMKEDIGLLLVTDTNDEHHPSSDIEHPLPFTDNLYDYYCVDPIKKVGARPRRDYDHPQQQKGEITLADARFEQERWNENAVTRNTPGVPNHRDVRKCKRQGQFDNVHIAARMQARIEGVTDPTLDDIVMINQCLHDCVHMHVRWSEFLDRSNFIIDTKMLHGWGPAGPYTKPGVPQVPPNQTVFLSFSSKHAVKYRALAEGCRAGSPQIFCHHGAAYAIDQWPTSRADFFTNRLHEGILALSLRDPYQGMFSDRWLEFYWRVRYMQHDDGRLIERLQFTLEKCMR